MEDLEKRSIKQFNTWAGWYDFPLNYLHFYLSNKPIVKLLNPPKGSSLLDVGCGTGILLEQFVKFDRTLHLFGFDISSKMLKQAEKKFHNQSNVKLQLGSASKLPYKDNIFDFVICSHSFHHHPDSMKSLREMKRVAKSGGKVLILDLSTDGIIRKILFKIENTIGREGKVYRYTRKGMKELFVEAGMVSIQQQTVLYADLVTVGIKKK